MTTIYNQTTSIEYYEYVLKKTNDNHTIGILREKKRKKDVEERTTKYYNNTTRIKNKEEEE